MKAQATEIGEIPGAKVIAATDMAGPQVIVKGDAIHLLSRPLKNHAAAVALGKKIVKAGTADIYKNWFDLNKGEEIGLFAIFGGQFRNL